MTAEGFPSLAERLDHHKVAPLFAAGALILTGLFIFLWTAIPGIKEAMRLALSDSDDAMRLASVRDFLAGQSWFDMNSVPLHAARRRVDALVASRRSADRRVDFLR